MRMLYSIPPSYRAARSAGIGELDSSIVKDFIDSEDPKHTLFCCEIAFVAKIYKYALIDKFQGSAGSLDSAASCAALAKAKNCFSVADHQRGPALMFSVVCSVQLIARLVYYQQLLPLFVAGNPW